MAKGEVSSAQPKDMTDIKAPLQGVHITASDHKLIGKRTIRAPAIVRLQHISPPTIVKTDVASFRSTVQILTGNNGGQYNGKFGSSSTTVIINEVEADLICCSPSQRLLGHDDDVSIISTLETVECASSPGPSSSYSPAAPCDPSCYEARMCELENTAAMGLPAGFISAEDALMSSEDFRIFPELFDSEDLIASLLVDIVNDEEGADDNEEPIKLPCAH